MAQQIGPYNLLGTDEQNGILAPMAVNMAAVLALTEDPISYRVQPTNVRVLPRDQMPWARKPLLDDAGNVIKKGVRAEGFWDAKRWPGDILLADDLFSRPDRARKTLAHEAMHQLDEQWLLKSNRKTIKPLFEPDAAIWPGEEYAVYGSAACFGFDDPPYTDFYTDYTIPKAEWPDVKAASLRDDHPVPPPPPDPPPGQVIEVPAGASVLVKAIGEVTP